MIAGLEDMSPIIPIPFDGRGSALKLGNGYGRARVLMLLLQSFNGGWGRGRPAATSC
jgi:hypothetical protein